jgi:hypothetical protein
MNRLFCSAFVLVVAGIILAWAYLAPAAPPEGKGYDRVLEKITFIHYKKGYAKPPWAGGGGTGEEGYYTYIANGFRWWTTEGFVFNPTNSGLDETLVFDSMVAGMAEWERYGGEIFGDLDEEPDWAATAGVSDDKNTFSFGDYGDSRVIAVTTVWGYFSGPPGSREITEADILFNTSGINWGDATVNEALMDLQNIATHEIGHCAGMGDLYQRRADEETMFGYSTEGETSKRDLYLGDIAGITNLYQ